MYGILITLALSGSGSTPTWGNGGYGALPYNGCFGGHGGYGGNGAYSQYDFPVSYAAGFGGIHGGCGGYFASGCYGWNGGGAGCHGAGCAGAAYSFGGGCYGYYISPYLVMPHSIPATTPSALAIREGGPVDQPLFTGPYTGPAPIHTVPTMTAPTMPTPTMPVPKATARPAVSRVIVSLPADAKLFADDQPTRAAGTVVRRFETPELKPGRQYKYNLRIEVVRDGQVVTDSKAVTVVAGAEVRVQFDEPKPVVRANTK